LQQKSLIKSQSAILPICIEDETKDETMITNKFSLEALMEKFNDKSPKKKTKDTSKKAALAIMIQSNMNKESPRQFLNSTRDILRSNMTIANLNEETDRLKDYIIMEREKIREAKN
jgi:hypothetical protein